MEWKELPAHVPLEAKAIAIAHWHQQALIRRAAVIHEFRQLSEISRALEGFWIVIEACLAHFAGRILTQKDITARATGAVSAATKSRTIRDIEAEGWPSPMPFASSTPKPDRPDYRRGRLKNP